MYTSYKTRQRPPRRAAPREDTYLHLTRRSETNGQGRQASTRGKRVACLLVRVERTEGRRRERDGRHSRDAVTAAFIFQPSMYLPTPRAPPSGAFFFSLYAKRAHAHGAHLPAILCSPRPSFIYKRPTTMDPANLLISQNVTRIGGGIICCPPPPREYKTKQHEPRNSRRANIQAPGAPRHDAQKEGFSASDKRQERGVERGVANPNTLAGVGRTENHALQQYHPFAHTKNNAQSRAPEPVPATLPPPSDISP